MRKILFPLLALCGMASAMYQYDDYPVGDYEYRHDRIAISPLKLVGGIDPDKIRKGPQSHFDGIPGIDIISIHYEHVTGAQGSFGFGPTLSVYPVDIGGDKSFTAVSGGGFFRYYAGIASATYFQLSAEYLYGSDAKFGAGDVINQAKTVKFGGPQISPAVGYSFLIQKKWFINVQVGYTLGAYNTKYDGGFAVDDSKLTADQKTTIGADGKPDPSLQTESKGYYKDGWRFGSFLNSAVELGFAF